MVTFLRFASAVFILITNLSLHVCAADQLIDDHTDKSPINEFDGYWRYYDDFGMTGANGRAIAAPGSRASEIDVNFTYESRNAFGNPHDTLKVRRYSVQISADSQESFITMPFTFGEWWHASWCSDTQKCSAPYVGVRTELAYPGKKCNLTGAKGVKFRIRSRMHEHVTVLFKVETTKLFEDSTGQFYQDEIIVDRNWTEFLIEFSTLKPPLYLADSLKKTFDYSGVTAFSWEINGLTNDSMSDTIDIDDIYICGYTLTNSNFEVKDEPVGCLLDITGAAFQPAGFNDSCAGGTSTLLSVKPDKYGTNMSMHFGGLVTTQNKWPFCGYRLNLTKLSQSNILDVVTLLTKEPPINIIFSTSTTVKAVRFEVFDKYNPLTLSYNNTEVSGSGRCSWYRRLANTGELVQHLSIPLAELIASGECANDDSLPLKLRSIAEIRFTVEGMPEDTGMIDIEKVYIPEICPDDVVTKKEETHVSALRFVNCRNRVVEVVPGAAFRGCEKIAVRILSPDGVTVKRYESGNPVKKITLDVRDLAPGGYILVVYSGNYEKSLQRAITKITLM